MNLLVVTQSYPYSAAREETFIDPELKVLDDLRKDYPDTNIFIAPLSDGGDLLGTVPSGMTIVDWLLPRGQFHALAAVWGRLAFYRSLADVILTRQKPVPNLNARLAHWRGWAMRYGQVWHCLVRNLDPRASWCLYTYWFDAATSACVDYAKLHSRSERPIRTITRAHGIDLYDERAFHPRRRRDIADIEHVYCDSQAGASYLIDRYGCFERISTQYLGVSRWNSLLPRERQPSKIFIVSCAQLIPLKRMPLLAKSLVRLANQRSDLTVQWHHFGGGHEENRVRSVLAEAPVNLAATLNGDVSNGRVREAFHALPYDCIVNLSESEGLPVSLMEAAEAHIPIIATNVGGNREIVRDGCGILLKADPTMDDVAGAILQICGPQQSAYADRAGQVWAQYFDAHRTHEAFYSQILSGGGQN